MWTAMAMLTWPLVSRVLMVESVELPSSGEAPMAFEPRVFSGDPQSQTCVRVLESRWPQGASRVRDESTSRWARGASANVSAR